MATKKATTSRTSGNGWKALIRTAGKAARMGPTIGTSSKRKASTPMTIGYWTPSSQEPTPAETPMIKAIVSWPRMYPPRTMLRVSSTKRTRSR